MITDGLSVVAGSNIEETIINPDKIGTSFPGSPLDGQLFKLTQTSGEYTPGNYEYYSGEWKKLSTGNTEMNPYDIAGVFNGKPTGSEVVFQFIAPRKFVIDANFENSQAACGVAPTAEAQFKIFKNATEVGQITFAAESSVGIFSVTPELTYFSGDTLKILCPSVTDLTLADIQITIAASLT